MGLLDSVKSADVLLQRCMTLLLNGGGPPSAEKPLTDTGSPLSLVMAVTLPFDKSPDISFFLLCRPSVLLGLVLPGTGDKQLRPVLRSPVWLIFYQ